MPKSDLKQQGIKLVQFYRENPVIAAKDLLNTEMVGPQRDILESMWSKNYVLISAGRGCGKTFINATFACLQGLLYMGQRVGFIAPSFRQAKMLFSEVEKIYNRAPILREASKRPPTKQSDRCALEFRGTGTMQGSLIEAQPLGDGSKIRGARYYVIIADEFAQIPQDIFNAVILPMGATVANPAENVKKIARQKELVEQGIAVDEDFEQAGNKVVMTSSAYYQFNHMYETLLDYRRKVEEGNPKYAVHQVSFRNMPEGFLSEDNIRDAKLRLSDIQFQMEYEAIWKSDSSGVFKASLIEKCREAAEHTVELYGDSRGEYVLGVDPARVQDAFAMVLIRLGPPNQIVAAWEYYDNVYPKMAKTIMDICDKYNVIAVHMDAGAGGGGTILKDILGDKERFGEKRLLDAEDEENIAADGRKLLYMFNPSSGSNSDAVFSSLNLMEKGNLTFPQRPQILQTGKDSKLEEREAVYETIEKMLRQMMLIEAKPGRTGATVHFDVPEGSGHGKQKKDLYSAFILAGKKAYDITVMGQEESTILEVGLIENRQPAVPQSGNTFDDNMGVINAPLKGWEFRKKF